MKEGSKKERDTEKENSFGQKELPTLGNFLSRKFKALVNTPGQIKSTTKVNGWMTGWMEKENFTGLMEEDIRENIRMTKSMDLVSFIGTTIEDTRGSGKMANR
jgi:hypothetical protein